MVAAEAHEVGGVEVGDVEGNLELEEAFGVFEVVLADVAAVAGCVRPSSREEAVLCSQIPVALLTVGIFAGEDSAHVHAASVLVCGLAATVVGTRFAPMPYVDVPRRPF